MAFGEDILKLRQRISDAVRRGLVSSDKDIFEASLIQIMNDAERNRQQCANQADTLRRQASVFDGQAAGFASISGIVYNVLNGFVVADERDEAERIAAEEQRKLNEVEVKEALKIEEVKIKKSKKVKSNT